MAEAYLLKMKAGLLILWSLALFNAPFWKEFLSLLLALVRFIEENFESTEWKKQTVWGFLNVLEETSNSVGAFVTPLLT